MLAIFGAAGFIGLNLVHRLVTEGRHAKAISRRITPELRSAAGRVVECVEADLNDPLESASALVGVTHVVQLVSVSSPGLKNDYVLSDITDNVLPHVRFMQDCVNAGVGRVLFISSGGTVYGIPRYLPIDEEHPSNPVSSHGMSKLMIEKYFGLFRHARGLDFTVLRVANAYGPHQSFRRGQGLIPMLRDRCLKGQPVTLFGNGSQIRDYIYVSDVVEAIMAAIEAPAAAGETFNVGSGEGHTVLDVITAVSDVLGRPIEVLRRPARDSDVPANVLDVSKAARVLGTAPTVSLSDGLARMLAPYPTHLDTQARWPPGPGSR